jgi:hypothetical protein
MYGVVKTLLAVPRQLYHVLVRSHLERLYFHGPAFWGVGFWSGQARTDICSQLTSFSSDFWALHPSECHTIVAQHLRTFIVSVETAMYSLLLYRCISGYVTHFTLIRPILREIRSLRRPHLLDNDDEFT